MIDLTTIKKEYLIISGLFIINYLYCNYKINKLEKSVKQVEYDLCIEKNKTLFIKF